MLKLTSKGLTKESKARLTDGAVVSLTAVGTHQLLLEQKEHRKLKTAGAVVGGICAMFVKNKYVSSTGMGVMMGATFFAMTSKNEILFKRKAA